MRKTSRKQTKVSKVLESLRHDITTGIFAPGEKLPMKNLKQRYNIGFSPLREALSRLVSHGLVRLEEQCGFSVAPLSLSELYDLYKMRTYIEELALRLSMEHGDDRWEADIVASWHRYEKYIHPNKNKHPDPVQWDSLQKEFLFNLVKACQSPWLLKIRELLYDQAERYRSVCLNEHHLNKKFLLAFVEENQRLVNAVLARDTDLAVSITNEGWESSIKMIEEKIKNNKTSV